MLSDNDNDESNDNSEYEILNISAEIGGGYKYSSELKVLNYK